MPLNFVLVESALQLVPRELERHPQVRRYAARRMKGTGEVLLDRTFHHVAMRKLSRLRTTLEVEKMGRPDIVHNTLLQILETPLNWEDELRVFVHTQDNHLITINPKIRLPKNYVRFVGLIEQLFEEGRVPQEGPALMEVENGNVQNLTQKIGADEVTGLSVLGEPRLMRTVAEEISQHKSPAIFIGGFPKGHFTPETKAVLKSTFRVDRSSLDAWIVGGRLVYDFEWAIGLAQRRIKPKSDAS